MSNPVPGWYPDPVGEVGKIRYWDGERWTEQVQDNPNATLPAGPPAGYQAASTPGQQQGQPAYSQGPATYQQAVQGGMVSPLPPKEREGMAIASLVLGIVSILLSCFGLFSALFGIVGLVLGILGRKGTSKGMALGGIITSIAGIVFGLLVTFFLAAIMSAITSNYPY